MVIDDFDVGTVAVFPAKADAPLVVDPDAPLAGPITGERFKPVAGRDAKEIKGGGSMQLLQLALGDPLHILRESGGETPVKELFRFFAGERADHR